MRDVMSQVVRRRGGDRWSLDQIRTLRTTFERGRKRPLVEGFEVDGGILGRRSEGRNFRRRSVVGRREGYPRGGWGVIMRQRFGDCCGITAQVWEFRVFMSASVRQKRWGLKHEDSFKFEDSAICLAYCKKG